MAVFIKSHRSNKPLTKEEVERIYDMEDGPIWVDMGCCIWPAILDIYNGELVAVWAADGEHLRIGNYGKTWLAYRYRPEE